MFGNKNMYADNYINMLCMQTCGIKASMVLNRAPGSTGTPAVFTVPKQPDASSEWLSGYGLA